MKNSICSLKQQIKELESNIINQKSTLHQEYADIKKMVSSPGFLLCGVLAVFGAGWLLVSKKSDKQIQNVKDAQTQTHLQIAMASLLGLLPIFKTYSHLLFK